MSETVQQHRAQSSSVLGCAVITVSDTRTLANDSGGQLVVDLLTAAGHRALQRRIIRDEPVEMRALLAGFCNDPQIDVILLTGGTGVGSRDQTFETISGLLTKTLPGYGELFRMLSYQQVKTAAMLSRAVGGLIGKIVVLTMPGSPNAVRLAMEQVILPEIAHLVREARR